MVLEIRTEVDEIVDLVKKYKTISLDDLSKKTGIEKSLLEQILQFLQEEGYVRLDYRLTKTFVKFVGDNLQNKKKADLNQNQDFEYEFASINSEALQKHLSEVDLMIQKLLFLELSLDLVQWRTLYVYIKKFASSIDNLRDYLEKKDILRIKNLIRELNDELDHCKQAIKDRNVLSYFNSLKNLYIPLNMLYRFFLNRHLSSYASLLRIILKVVRQYLAINGKKQSLFEKVDKVLDAIRREDLYSAEQYYNEIISILDNENFYDINKMNDEEKKDFNDALSLLTNQVDNVKSIDEYFDKYLQQKELVLKNIDFSKINITEDTQSKGFGKSNSLEVDTTKIERFKNLLFKDLRGINERFNVELSKLQKASKRSEDFNVKQKKNSSNNTIVKTIEKKKLLDKVQRNVLDKISEVSNTKENTEQKKEEDLLKEHDELLLKEIQIALVKVRKLLDEGKAIEALKLIKKLKGQVQSISDNFYILKKMNLSKEIYEFESKILDKVIELNRSRIERIFDLINQRISYLDAYIEKYDFNSFMKEYRYLRSLINGIPDLFRVEKENLSILLYRKLIKLYTFRLEDEKRKKVIVKKQFFDFLSKFEEAKKVKNYKVMLSLYLKMSDLVSSLNESEFKLHLLKDLDVIFMRIIDILIHLNSQRIKRIKESFLLIINNINKNISNLQFKAAIEQYHKAIVLLNSVPPGFFDETFRMREELRNVYDALLKKMNEITKDLKIK